MVLEINEYVKYLDVIVTTDYRCFLVLQPPTETHNRPIRTYARRDHHIGARRLTTANDEATLLRSSQPPAACCILLQVIRYQPKVLELQVSFEFSTWIVLTMTC